MKASQRAKLMLRWEGLRETLNDIEAVIIEDVLELGETVTVGNVRATYSAGRKKYDYEAAGKQAPQNVIDKHTRPMTDWRAVCEEGGPDVPFTQGEPSVKIKLLE